MAALREIYNISFDQRGKPDVHVSLVSSKTLELKVQQHEIINSARTVADFVEESFHIDLTIDDIELTRTNGQRLNPTQIHRKSKIASALKQGQRFVLDHTFHIDFSQALNPGGQYKLRLANLGLDEFIFTPQDSISLSIHHARAYDLNSPIKQAKISS